MKMFDVFCEYLSKKTTIDKEFIMVIFTTIFVLALFSVAKLIGKKIIKKATSGRREFTVNQVFKIIINIIEIMVLLLVWGEFIKNLMTLISVLSAAMTIALREIILNFFCGIYIKIKKPFKVEDRIQIDDIKGDVMSISGLSFEILEVSNKDDYGQSTGIIINYPNSIVFSKAIKNLNKGFKYIWNEITVDLCLDCDLSENKKELYRIINNIETIKSIPKKMMNQIDEMNNENRVYFNKYEPIIYTRIVKEHIELTVRYLMHFKKVRYVESTIWNKIYNSFREGRLDLFVGNDVKLDFNKNNKDDLDEEVSEKKTQEVRVAVAAEKNVSSAIESII